jgi:serine/threonine protein kinase
LIEAKRNSELLEHHQVIKAVALVPARAQMPHISLAGVEYSHYSYILVPYCSKGSLLDFILKAIEKKKRLSRGLVKFLALQLL